MRDALRCWSFTVYSSRFKVRAVAVCSLQSGARLVNGPPDEMASGMPSAGVSAAPLCTRYLLRTKRSHADPKQSSCSVAIVQRLRSESECDVYCPGRKPELLRVHLTSTAAAARVEASGASPHLISSSRSALPRASIGSCDWRMLYIKI
jgi:hypothetical protein